MCDRRKYWIISMVIYPLQLPRDWCFLYIGECYRSCSLILLSLSGHHLSPVEISRWPTKPVNHLEK